ncbi:unnamed protein product [[Candida] boidinii]|nr:unnamed protein product [[Candida] boidinii]
MSDSTTDSLKPLNSIPTNGTDNDSTNNKNNTNENDNSNLSVLSIDSAPSSNSSNKNDHANNNNKNNDTLSISSTLTNATLTSPTIQFIKSASDSPVLRPSSGSLYQNEEEHLKPILKKKTNVEKIMSEASYSRLQILLDEREHKFNGSPILEHTSGVAVSPFLHSEVGILQLLQ